MLAFNTRELDTDNCVVSFLQVLAFLNEMLHPREVQMGVVFGKILLKTKYHSWCHLMR